MNKNYRGLVAFDVDNTLLDHNTERITDSALRGVRELQKNDYLTVVATGRDMHSRYSEKYLPIIDADALVHMNGCRVELRSEDRDTWQSGEILLDHQMDRALLKRILDYCTLHHHAIGCSIGDEDYYTYPEDVVKHDLNYWGNSDRSFADPYKLLELPVRAIAYCGNAVGAADIQAAFPECHVFMFSEHTGADVFEVGFSKLDGLKRLAKHFDIPWSKTYAFGDSFNDKIMIEGVAHGIAVGNAITELKEVAEHVTDPIWEDGIYHALRHYALV